MSKTAERPKFILLNVGYSELNANWNWKSVYSPFARIYYVTSGKAITYINGEPFSLKPDHLYLVPPFTMHDNECDSFFSLYYIHFYEETVRKESIFDQYDFPIEVKSDSLGLMLNKRLLEINPGRHLRHYDPKLYDNPRTFDQYVADNSKMSIHSRYETQGILYQLISRFFTLAKTKSDNKDVRISNTLRYIHENTGKDITLAELANVACVSEDHLIRVFKKEMNCTPLRYVNMKKIEKAQLLLLTTDMPIRDVAMELSLDNISYFNRVFKHHIGKTPSEYRETYNNL